MATEKEEIILDFKVESGDLVSELEKLKKQIVSNKQEQIALNKAFRDGKITESEYAKESVRVENALKRQQKQYSDTQKAVLGHKSKIDELIKSNDKLAKSNQSVSKGMSDFTQNLTIAGVNVGGLTSKMSGFAKAGVAAGAIVSGLSSLYAKSAVGARDLATAQESVGAGLDILANKLGNLSQGEGFFTKVAQGLTLAAGDVTGGSRGVADAQNAFAAQKALRSLTEQAIDAARIRKQTEKEAEDARRIRDDQEKKLIERLTAANVVEEKLKQNETERVKILKAQVEETLKYGVSVGTINRDVIREYRKQRDVLNGINFLGITDQKTRESIKKNQAEIADIQEEINGKLTENIKSRTQILNLIDEQRQKEGFFSRNEGRLLEGERLKDATELAEEASGIKPQEKKTLTLAQQAALARESAFAQARINIQKNANDTQKKSEELYTKFITKEQSLRYNAVAGVLGQLSQLAKEGSDEQKTLGLLQIALSSGVGVAEAVKAGAGIGFPGNLVAIAAGVSTVLAGIAQAKSLLGFAEGGYTGPGGKHQVAGVVHKDEYVVPKHIVHNPMYSGHISALERARLHGYADGGIVAKAATSEANNSLAMINAMKQMPQPVVDLMETARGLRKLELKQKYSRR